MYKIKFWNDFGLGSDPGPKPNIYFFGGEKSAKKWK